MNKQDKPKAKAAKSKVRKPGANRGEVARKQRVKKPGFSQSRDIHEDRGERQIKLGVRRR